MRFSLIRLWRIVRADFENQSIFFRTQSTVLKKKGRREWRSPRLYPEEHRGPPWRALQSPVYIRKKPAVNKREKEKRKNFVAVITQFVS